MDDQQGSSLTFGEYLARERKLRNIHLREIAEQTRINVDILKALESNAVDRLPPEAYVIGFVCAYARHIGLDENEVLLRYEDYLQSFGNTRGDTERSWSYPRKYLLWGILILALALLGAYLLWRLPAPDRVSRHPLPAAGAIPANPPSNR
jgi:cytoskeletal protein RodZ